ncbi:putative T7SS-secreted protein [Streptomyces jumonjinensis]|uniref:putative T7SS-secreted protein n=1 Tax=Streptomyces jumonjinensis TaxID=1945 RepID=UPI003794CA80
MGIIDKFKDAGGAVYDGVRDGVDKGKELLGEGVDAATNAAGDVLEKVGADDVADSVEDWGDRSASSLGADVDEQQLGQTEEANELIHGNPGKIAGSVKNLRDFQRAFDAVGSGMRKLDSSHWKGQGADAFREKFSVLPTDWLRAADAFGDAAKALENFSKTVTWAQGQAREAIALHKKGQQTSKDAVESYNKRVDAYNAARAEPNPPPRPEPFTDPGTAERERARHLLKEARRQRDEAADTAKAAVSAALAHAPAEPEGWDRLKADGMDWALASGTESMHLLGGVAKGTAGLLNFVRSVNPVDPYNLTHPAEYYKNVNMTLAGLASTAANPDRALKNAWEAAKGDPSEFIGRLIPEIVGAKGAGALRGGLRARGALDNLASRGSGPELPSFDEVKRAVTETKPEVLSRKWPDDDGRYYATRVLRGGRPDGEPVLAGHGFVRIRAGEITVPPGTHISFYIDHGEKLPGLNGLAVERGVYPGPAVETFGPGDRIPNYTLGPPEAQGFGGFTVYENSVTVAQKTALGEILKENMGNVHWAACREIDTR